MKRMNYGVDGSGQGAGKMKQLQKMVILLLLLFCLPCFIACQKAPVINQFYADNLVVGVGEKDQLHWSASGVNSIIVKDSDGNTIAISDNSCLVYPRKTTAYTLIASNDVGTDNKTVVITIDPIKTGDMYLKLGHSYYNVALQEYESAIAINPNLQAAWIGKIQCLLNLSQYEDAIRTCSMAAELFPTSSPIYCICGIAYDRNGQYDTAIIDLNKAIGFDPKNALAYIQRGNSYSNKNVHETSDDPDNVRGGWAYGDKDQWAKAIADFDNGIELDRKNPILYYSRGACYVRSEQWDNASSDFLEIRYILPNGDAFTLLGSGANQIANSIFRGKAYGYSLRVGTVDTGKILINLFAFEPFAPYSFAYWPWSP